MVERLHAGLFQPMRLLRRYVADVRHKGHVVSYDVAHRGDNLQEVPEIECRRRHKRDKVNARFIENACIVRDFVIGNLGSPLA